MNKKQNELIKRYCLSVMECSFIAYDNHEVSREIIFEELINVSKSHLLEKAIRWDELSEFNPFENL